MKDIILYGSQYGSTYRYAQKLSEQTGIPAVSYKDAPALSDKKIIVYLGGLYAGGILGLMKTLRGFSLRDGQKLLDRAKVFHLRGGIDYQKLAFGHRTMMKLLYQSLRRTPLEKQTTEDRALIETYGKQVDFTDFGALEPIIWEIQRETK